jgi:hypothetical protein
MKEEKTPNEDQKSKQEEIKEERRFKQKEGNKQEIKKKVKQNQIDWNLELWEI